MKKTLSAAVILLGTAGFAGAQTMPAPLMSSPPPGKTVTKFYKQSVYDPAKNKIGTVDDVIVGDRGQISGLIIGVGGFLGAGGERCRRGVQRRARGHEEWRLVPDPR